MLKNGNKFISVCQRSEIESKSQPASTIMPVISRLYQYVKDQKLKANHNHERIGAIDQDVYISMSKIRN